MSFKKCPIDQFLFMVIFLTSFFSALPAAADSPQVGGMEEQTTLQTVLKRYLEVLYSRDYSRVYALVSTQDKQWKSKEEYLRENPSFVGPELDLARKLATFSAYQNVVTKMQGNRATVKLTFRIPNANDPALLQLLRGFDSERLASLATVELDALKARLNEMHRAGQLPTIEGEQQWELIKEPQGWRVFLNWAGAIRVRFAAEVKDNLPWRFWPVQQEVLALPGKTLQAVYRVKNLSGRPVTAKAIHIDEPKELADKYLEIIQCFCFLQSTLEAGEEKELPLTFRIRWDAPETIRSFSIRYVFYPIESLPSEERMAFPLPEKPSIAVLPFVNMSDDPKQEYFSDGISEDLINDLSSISSLFVIARNSTFAYKGKPAKIRQIAEELGVRYVLKGSIGKADNRVRINAQLIDAFIGHQLWAKRYDGKMGDIFELQDRITQKIVGALAVKLTTDEQNRIARKETDNIEAYDTFLKGWEHYYRLTPDGFAKALFYFKKAIEFDQNYGRAYGMLALTYFWGSRFRWLKDIPYPEGFLLARKFLQVSMKDGTSIAYQVASWMNVYMQQYKEAISNAELAIALDPNNQANHGAMASALNFIGKPEEAIDYAKTSLRLDPHRPGLALYFAGLAYFCMGQYGEALTFLERAITYNPEAVWQYIVLAASYAHLGRDEDAKAALDNYIKSWPSPPNLRDIMYFHPFKDQEVADRFAEGLLKAGLPGEPSGY